MKLRLNNLLINLRINSLVFASAENVLVKPFISLIKITASPFHQSILVCIKQIMTGKPSSAVVCCFKVSFTVKWKKNCQIGQRQLYSRIVVWKIIKCSKYQLIFVTAEGVLSKPFLSWLKKKITAHRFTHWLYVC